jgi:hypothetical protein
LLFPHIAWFAKEFLDNSAPDGRPEDNEDEIDGAPSEKSLPASLCAIGLDRPKDR